ncbi:MAG: hypothetical protein GWP05_05995 [Anaerolineaceae bacterium]|nr:hypothetical protein [Anaerolineaceae bacterium]
MGLKSLRKKAFDYLLYVALRMGVLLIQLFPIEVMQLIARGLGNLFYLLDKKHRRRAIDNLTQAFGDQWSQRRVRATARKCCQHMIMLGMEILSLAKLINRHTWHEYVELDNVAETLRVICDNRGIILLTGHFGNWEVLGYMVGALGIRTYAIARPIDNPYIDRWLMSHRQETGQSIINKFGAADLAVKVIQSEQALCFLGDQHAGRKGIWVDFFGRKASTYKSIALLSMQMNCPIAVVGAWRLGNRFKFRTYINDVIDPQQYANDKEAVLHITQRYTKDLENIIRQAPDQYLWMHRRWREPPPPRKKKKKPRATLAKPAL